MYVVGVWDVVHLCQLSWSHERVQLDPARSRCDSMRMNHSTVTCDTNPCPVMVLNWSPNKVLSQSTQDRFILS